MPSEKEFKIIPKIENKQKKNFEIVKTISDDFFENSFNEFFNIGHQEPHSVAHYEEKFPKGISSILKSKESSLGGIISIYQPKGAEKYQKQVLAEVVEDPTITDYSVAYRRLVDERNKPWKLNPSDIADFYLLERFVSQSGPSTDYQEDSRYVAVEKAKARITEIGKRLLVSMAHEQLDEYDRFTTIKPQALPDDLRNKIHEYYVANTQQEIGGEQEAPAADVSVTDEINYYLADFKANLDRHADRNDSLNVFDDKDMLATALQILETQQVGRWQVMATAMRALHDKTYPVSEFMKKISPANNDPETMRQIEQNLEQHRETFLIDRLINYVHNTGRMSARVTNYFPRSASILLAHGLPGHDQYLMYHSSLVSSTDTLAMQVKKSIASDKDRDLIDDFVAAIESGQLPREYKYALLLEFGDKRIHDAVADTSKGDKITPSRVYKLLQRISHHDGRSKGRLRKTA